MKKEVLGLSSGMKTGIKTFLIVFTLTALALTMISCAGAPGPIEQAMPAEPEVAPGPEVTAEIEPEPEPRRIEEQKFVVRKERFYYPDGTLDEYKIYTYTEADGPVLEKETLYNADHEVLESIEYIYESDLLTERIIKDKAGDIRQKRLYFYDEQGYLIEEKGLNRQEELQARMEYDYNDAGRRITWSVYDASGTLLGYTEYIYEESVNTRIENYSPGGRLEEYFELEYEDGLLTKNSQFDRDKRSQGYRVFAYDDSLLTEEVIYRANESVLRRMIYSYNDNGNKVETITLDGGDNVRERVFREFKEYIVVRYE